MLRGAFALWALLFASSACAQFSGRVSLLSDYRYRGVSLSDGKPVLQLGAAYDHPSGGYAGILVSHLRYVHRSEPDTLLLPYLGYAWRLRPGLSAELGVQYSRFLETRWLDYTEFYAGFSTDHFGGRIYYAKKYFGYEPTLYAELNGTHKLTERLRALGHIGALRFSSGSWSGTGQDRYRYDARVGVGLALDAFDLQLTWGTAQGGDGAYLRYPYWDATDRSAWTLGLSRNW